MSTFTYQLRVKRSEGALVRILGLTRRRRYDVIQLLAYPSADEDFMDVQMTVRSKRAAPVLARQLEKLLEVSHVQVLDGEPSANLHTKAASL